MNLIPFVFAAAVIATAAGCGNQASRAAHEGAGDQPGHRDLQARRTGGERTAAADDAASVRPRNVDR